MEARIDSFKAIYGDDIDNLRDSYRNKRAFDLFIELSKEKHHHHKSLVLYDSDPDWDAIKRLSKDIKRAELELGLQRGNYQGY